MVGTTIYDGATKQHADAASAHHRKVVESGVTSVEERNTIVPDGSAHQALVTKFPIFDDDGNLTLIGSIATDITNLKETEKQLVLARETADLANRSKSEFLANMSHELRTPLNAMIGFSDASQAGIYGPFNAQQKERIGDIIQSSSHLLGLINDILDISKIEAGEGELHEENIDLADVTRFCAAMIRERATAGGISLIMKIADAIPLLRGDPRRLKRIFINLLSNAVKFTKAGGTVTIETRYNPDSGYVIQFIDTGIGIAADDIPKAIVRFQQIDGGLNREYEGTGLGLPLRKSLVEMHDGSLDLQSQVGKGTTVTVRLPADRAVRQVGLDKAAAN